MVLHHGLGIKRITHLNIFRPFSCKFNAKQILYYFIRILLKARTYSQFNLLQYASGFNEMDFLDPVTATDTDTDTVASTHTHTNKLKNTPTERHTFTVKPNEPVVLVAITLSFDSIIKSCNDMQIKQKTSLQPADIYEK